MRVISLTCTGTRFTGCCRARGVIHRRYPHIMGSDLLELALRIVKATWRWRFHIPRPAFWALIGAGASLAFFGGSATSAVTGAAGAALGIGGLANWSYYSSPRPLLAIPLFAGPRSERGRPEDIQRMVVTTLQDRIGALLPPDWVRAVPVEVGPDRIAFAHRLIKRIKARYLLYGESRVRQDGGYQVFARLAVRADPTIEHWDGHTKDKTPQHTIWHTLTEKLTPQLEVGDVEYPFEFAAEMEALVRSLEGTVYGYARRWDLSEKALRSALNVAPNSDTGAVDQIRVNLDPLNPFMRGPDPARLQEAVDLLRRASADRGDPLRPMSQYNLATLLLQRPETRNEGLAILDRLRRSRTHYARAWYVRRPLGVGHWALAQQLRDQGHDAAAEREFARAATWYSRAIRARPKLRLRRVGRHFHVQRYPRSAMLHANAWDAHHLAGHRLRSRYHRWRFHRRRTSLWGDAIRAMRDDDWPKAYANFDWQIVGYKDLPEIAARVGRAIALKQLGREEAASTAYREAVAIDEQAAADIRATMLSEFALTRGVPE